MLKPIRPGLRTIHNGSNDVAKAAIVVPAGGELTVPESVADQLLASSGAFKDGAADQDDPADDGAGEVILSSEAVRPDDAEPAVQLPAVEGSDVLPPAVEKLAKRPRK